MEQKPDVRKSFIWYYFDLKFKTLDTALKLQAKEYERRLEALNGENEKIEKILDQSIPREVFDRTIIAIHEKYERLHNDQSKRLADLENYKTRQEGVAGLIKWIPIAIAIAAIIISFYKK